MSGGPSRFLLAPSCCRKAGQVERIGGNAVRGKDRPGRAKARRHTTTRIPQSRCMAYCSPSPGGSTPPPSRCPRQAIGVAVVHEALLINGGGIDGGDGAYFSNAGDDVHAVGSLAPIVEGHVGCIVIRPDGSGELAPSDARPAGAAAAGLVPEVSYPPLRQAEADRGRVADRPNPIVAPACRCDRPLYFRTISGFAACTAPGGGGCGSRRSGNTQLRKPGHPPRASARPDWATRLSCNLSDASPERGRF
jgi:hypothetical protein